MAEDDYDGYIDEGAEYSPKSEFSKPALTYKAVEKCIEARAKEMRKGYYNTTITKDGLPIKSWIGDTRRSYCEAVHALRLTLTPELIADEKFDEDQFFFNEIEKSYSYFIYELYIDNDGKRKYKKTDKYFLPEIDSIIDIRTILPDGSEALVPTPGGWNKYIDAYWSHSVRECDALYNELMRVIHRLNYFAGEVRYG